MSLDVKTANNSYAFDGPFKSSDSLETKSGVYVISTLAPSKKHTVLDVGESSNLQERVGGHDRADEWQEHIQDGLFYSAYYCNEATRMTVETELRDYFKPPCGKK